MRSKWLAVLSCKFLMGFLNLQLGPTKFLSLTKFSRYTVNIVTNIMVFTILSEQYLLLSMFCLSFYLCSGPCSAGEVPPSTLTLAAFMTHIASQIPTKWETFGILLGIPFHELKAFPPNNSFAHVFDWWQKRGRPEVSWETVVRVLESPPLEEMTLALRVREMR